MLVKENAIKVATLGFALAGLAMSANAGPNVSGAVELGYNYNLTIPTHSQANTGHSYDAKSKTFTLNNAHIALSGSDSASHLGYVVETDLGTDAAFNNAFDFGVLNSTSSHLNLQEAYATWTASDGKCGFKAGKFATTEGIEVIEGGSNPTITRGFLYGMAEPVTHTGAVATAGMGMVDVNLGLANGWDVVSDNNNAVTILAKVGLNMGDPLALTLSGIIGPEQAGNTDDYRMSFDATGITKVLPMTDLWFQVNYGMEAKASVAKAGDDASWFGLGVQPLIHFNGLFGLGLRYEFFMDDGLSRSLLPSTGTDISLQNISIAPTFWLNKNLTARAEYRIDMASEDVYADGDGKATGTQMEIAADLVATF